MRSIMATLGVVFFMLSVAPVLLHAEQVVFERPTWVVGEIREYVNQKGETSRYKITEVSETGFVAVRNDNERIEFDRDGNRVEFEVQWLKFPLQIGKKWKYESRGGAASNLPLGVTYVNDVEVKKITTVTIKAGTFEVMLIDLCWNRSDYSRVTGCFKLWYSPKTKWFVKRESPSGSPARERDFELVSYTLAGE